MVTDIQEATTKRGYRIILLTAWAKRNKWTEEEIATHALLRFVCSGSTARGYAREVILRLKEEQTASMLEEEAKQ